MFSWTKEIIDYRLDACTCQGAERLIAEELATSISPGEIVLDAGCGIGIVSLALAQSVKKVIALDTNALAIDTLRSRAKAQHCTNLEAIVADAFTYPIPHSCHTIVCTFFAQAEELLRLCGEGRTILVITRDYEEHRFSLSGRKSKRMTYQSLAKMLDSHGIAHTDNLFELDMGQPFRSIDAACRFFAIYGETEIDKKDVEARLVPLQGNSIFPYYLPMPRRCAKVEFIGTKESFHE